MSAVYRAGTIPPAYGRLHIGGLRKTATIFFRRAGEAARTPETSRLRMSRRLSITDSHSRSASGARARCGGVPHRAIECPDHRPGQRQLPGPDRRGRVEGRRVGGCRAYPSALSINASYSYTDATITRSNFAPNSAHACPPSHGIRLRFS